MLNSKINIPILGLKGLIILQLLDLSNMSRNRYTPAEDNAILDFVEKNKDMLKVGGNKLWKKAESERVTLQSWQSMKSQFQPLAPSNLGPKTTPKRRKIDAT